MSLPDVLFKGVPRQWTRGYTAEVIRRQEPERVVIPCVGAYALATTVVEAGIDPSRIEACDISLYSTVIGRMLAGQEFPSLRAKGEFEWLNEYMTDPLRRVAAVVVAIRLLQYLGKKNSLYKWERVREVMERREVYLEQARRSAEKMFSRLAGLSYEAGDLWDLLERYVPGGDDRDEEGKGGTLILCNPPRYTGGYDKMYQGVDDAFDWDEPSVSQFDETQYRRLVDYLADGPRALIYYATPVSTQENPAEEWGPPWTSVFAARPRTGKTAAINWIVSNRPNLAPSAKLQRSDIEAPARGRYKMFREGLIRSDSRLEVRVEKKEVVDYYRDLLVHNLGMVNAERHKVLLLDGKLLAVMGAHLQNLRASGVLNGICKLTFAFTVDHPGYDRLHKLTLMSVVSSWFWTHEISDIEAMPRAIQTTMLTPRPEVKTARGIFKLKDRERDPTTGWNKLTYYAELVDRTPEETLGEWLRRWGEVKPEYEASLQAVPA